VGGEIVYRRNLAILLLFIIGAGIVGWVFTRVRAEPVNEITIKWSTSGHADRTSPAFRAWDENDPPVIPPVCAKCHSTLGYLDFIGEDGTEPGRVDNAPPIGTTVQCVACHNPSSMAMTTVTFPSGVEIGDLNGQGNCLQCHQGRASTVQVNNAIEGQDPDAVLEDQGFISVHYRPAAATRWGGEVSGAYEYPNREYVEFFEHTRDYQQCSQCHDAHSLQIDPQECAPCHSNVVGVADLRGIRDDDTDWSGRGETTQGVAVEIDTLWSRLYDAVRLYAAEVVGTPIVYSAGANPYFFIDTNGDGVADPEETVGSNSYASWTPRLLRAAYNLHYMQMDPGGFAHNPRYMIQILHDSLADLAEQVDVDMTGLIRP
jgi:hypothetical protein